MQPCATLSLSNVYPTISNVNVKVEAKAIVHMHTKLRPRLKELNGNVRKFYLRQSCELGRNAHSLHRFPLLLWRSLTPLSVLP